MTHGDIFSVFEGEHAPVLTSGTGATLLDEEGRDYLNFSEMTVCLGEGNQAYIRRIKEALDGGLLTNKGRNLPKEALIERLIGSTQGQFPYVLLTSSGSEAVEWSVKFCRKLTGRTETVTFWNSIHGRTQFSSNLSGLPRRKQGYGPIEGGHVYAPYPRCECCPLGSCETCGFACLEFLKEKIRYESTGDIAAVLIEPVQAYANVFPPAGFLRALREWTRQEGILLIFDEIQSGMGRSGSLYRYQAEGVVPDVLLLGKALGNGMHIAAALFQKVPDKAARAAAFGGSADEKLACVAANYVLEALTEGGLLEHIQYAGKRLRVGLEKLRRRFPAVAQVWGEGLALAMEFQSVSLAAAVHARLSEERVYAGCHEREIVLKPVYTLSDEEIDQFLCRLERALCAAAPDQKGA